jgi:uncharacterized hydrophobic protein (TIGR00271 family)
MREKLRLVKGYILQFWERNTGNWQLLLEKPVPQEELNSSLEQNSIPSFGFYLMLSLATIIATLGLLADSTATIIGAMIVAPLMNPIMSLAYSLVTGNRMLLRRSAITLVSGIILTIAIAYISNHLLDLTVARQEIIGRGNPNILDLGVAMAAGAAAAFAYTRKSIANSLAGVAIAVALVPPLSVVGIGLSLGNRISLEIGLSLGDNPLALGAFLLFLTNLVGIVFCAALVFLFQGYGSWLSALKGLLVSLLGLFIVFIPLDISFRELILEAQVRQATNDLRKARPELFKNAVARSLTVDLRKSEFSHKEIIYIEVEIFAPVGTVDEYKLTLAQNFLSKYFAKPVKLKIKEVIYYNVYG